MSVARQVMRLVRRVTFWLRFSRRQDELREELAFHREQIAAELERRGLEPSALRRTMGNELSMREEAREVWLAAGLDALLKDCRHAWRALRRTPVFTSVAISTLALGIGANTAIFSVVHHLLLAPLPYPDGNRIVRLGTESLSDPSEPFNLPLAVLSRLEQRSRALEDFSAGGSIVARLGDTANKDAVPGAVITPSLLHTLRVSPVAGRSFTADDARAEAPPVAMISDGLWRSRFGGARDALGRTIRVNGELRTIVGITPPELSIPMRVEDAPQIWLPLDPADDEGLYNGYARLRPGATTSAARRELQAVMAERPDPRWSKATGPSVTRAVDRVDARLKRALEILFVAVTGLLLIACANIANLLLMRGWTRQRELTIRRALGGGWFRVARHLLIESSTLAVIGGALGLLIAWKGLSMILALLPGGMGWIPGGPDLRDARISAGVLGWTTATTIVTSLLFGVGPALLSTGEATAEALRAGSRGVSARIVARRLRTGIVVGQIALSFVFLVAAALLVRSFVTLARLDVGYDARGLAIVSVDLSRKPDAAAFRASTERALTSALAAVPGVTAVAFGGALLRTDIRGGPFVVDGPNGPEQLALDMCEMPFVSRDYFRVSGIPLLRGRTFESDDDLVINQKLARRFWPSGNALGARVQVGYGAKARWLTVVGIAGDINLPGVNELFTMQMYRPTSAAGAFVNLVSFRTPGNPEALTATVKRAIESAGVGATVGSIGGVESILDRRILARPRFALVIFGVFASVALLLTAVGLYAIVAYTVTQRTPEIGVRVALGADSMTVSRMIVADGMRHVAAGVALGIVVAFATTHLLASFLYDSSAFDPRAIASAVLLLGFVTLIASAIPLRRALSIAPVDALRAE